MATPNSYPAGSTLSLNTSSEWTKEGGVRPINVIEGNIDEINARYLAEIATGDAYGTTNLAGLRYEVNRGRARLIRTFNTVDQSVEELYAVDVIRDIREANYFKTLTDAQITAVQTVNEDRGAEVAGWNALQKTLFKHMRHGVESFIDKQFILRTSNYVSIAVLLQADFTGLGTVVSVPTLSTDMTRLIASLPTGEWLQGPQQAERVGKGRWRVDNELQWALKWSVIYGGTLYAP